MDYEAVKDKILNTYCSWKKPKAYLLPVSTIRSLVQKNYDKNKKVNFIKIKRNEACVEEAQIILRIEKLFHVMPLLLMPSFFKTFKIDKTRDEPCVKYGS